MKVNVWEKAKNLQKEGTFRGIVVRTRYLQNSAGAQILVRLDGESVPTPDYDTLNRMVDSFQQHLVQSPENNHGDIQAQTEAYRNLLFSDAIDRLDAESCVKIVVYCDGWKYVDDLKETDEQDIDVLLRQIRTGHRITFRLSKNWRGKKYYCRYIRDEDLGLYSGYMVESDWRQEQHPYRYVPADGESVYSILHKEYITDDFDNGMLSLEVCKNTDTVFQKYRLLALSGSAAYKALLDMPDTDLHKHRFLITVTVDPETGKSYADKLSDLDKSTEQPTKARKRLRSDAHDSYDYAAMRLEAEKCLKLPVSEMPPDQDYREYKATVRDDTLTDFSKTSFKFLPLTLSDGREICPDIRARTKKSKDAVKIAELLGRENQLTEKSRMYPGTKVTLYFTPDLHKQYLMLRFLTIDDTAAETELRKLEYLRTVLIRNNLLPKSEAKVNISRMSVEERDRYVEILNRTAKNLPKTP